MSIPKQLMIGSVPYEVEVVKGWIDEKENGEVRIAEVTYHEQQIKISDNVAKHEGQMKTYFMKRFTRCFMNTDSIV